jgi:RNA polymerase sigma factor (sigma-70 family)
MIASLNPALFKLKISKAKCPVYTGQVLPLLNEKLRTNQNDSLNNAFYQVQSVSKQVASSEDKQETYKIALTPVEWDPVELDWSPSVKEASVSPHPFDISISSQELYDSFGIKESKTGKKANTVVPGTINEFVAELFKRADKYPEFVEKHGEMDFDKIFRTVAYKTFTPYEGQLAIEDKEDIFFNALITLWEKDTLDRYNSEKGNFQNYIWGCFHNALRNEIRKFQSSAKYERKPTPFTEEYNKNLNSELDMLTTETPQNNPADIVEANEMWEDFKDYVSIQPRAEMMLSVLKYLPERVKKVEIAKDLGVSSAYISQTIKKIISLLKEYAEESDNPVLVGAISAAEQRKKGTEEDSDWQLLQSIYDIFEEDSSEDVEHTAADESEKTAERVPVGETIRIKRRPMPDFEELTKKVVQDPERSASQAEEDITSYFQEITSADELIETDGKLIALSIVRRE